MHWRPSATLDRLRRRAALLREIREFFAQRDVLEVETPQLCTAGVTDPAIEPLIVSGGAAQVGARYLQTSPEYAMKRLLAAYGEPIWQLARVFRDGEVGDRHSPEFSMLEWYRPGFDLHALMDEVAELVSTCLGERPFRRVSYREVFLDIVDLDPMTATAQELESRARQQFDVGSLHGDRDLWLDVLLTHAIEPQLSGCCFVYNYPASQAALAQTVSADGVHVAQRFELYVDGLELANGYRELTDAHEQRLRFDADNRKRQAQGLAERPVDERLLAALQSGLPECSGVALGLDRLLMLATDSTAIGDVLAFDWGGA